jgi:hypothetical protein
VSFECDFGKDVLHILLLPVLLNLEQVADLRLGSNSLNPFVHIELSVISCSTLLLLYLSQVFKHQIIVLSVSDE